IWIDRPARPQRSIAELLSVCGAYLAAGATVLIPGLAGHAAQTAPRGASLVADWAHVAAGSLWIGGLIGLLVLWLRFPVARRVAGQGARERGERRRARRARAGDRGREQERLPAAVPGRAESRCFGEHVLAADHAGGKSADACDGRRRVRDAGHGDGHAELHPL